MFTHYYFIRQLSYAFSVIVDRIWKLRWQICGGRWDLDRCQRSKLGSLKMKSVFCDCRILTILFPKLSKPLVKASVVIVGNFGQHNFRTSPSHCKHLANEKHSDCRNLFPLCIVNSMFITFRPFMINWNFHFYVLIHLVQRKCVPMIDWCFYCW